jgi:hypothetical protein
MGCGDACPVLPGRRYLDWDLPDPAEAEPEESVTSAMTSPDACSCCCTSCSLS